MIPFYTFTFLLRTLFSLGHLIGSFSKDKATPVETARADLTISLTNGRAPEVAFSPFRAIVFSFEVALSLLNLAH